MATLKYASKEELNQLVENINAEIAFLEKVEESTDISRERSYAYTVGQIHAYRAMKETLEKFIRWEIG